MKRAVGQQVDQLKAKLSGYAAMLAYRYANLCIEAHPAALLSAVVEVEGESKHLEEVAQVAVKETYHFIVNPIYEEDLFPIGKAIMMEHPEFKQEIKTWDGYDETDPAGKYLYYTMPEVNKDRHDVLIKAVDAFYDECKQKMKAAEQDCVTQLAGLQADSSPTEIEQVAEYVHNIMKTYSDMRDSSHDTKKQEVEKAYAEYQEKQKEKEAEEKEERQAAGNPLQMVMQGGGDE